MLHLCTGAPSRAEEASELEAAPLMLWHAGCMHACLLCRLGAVQRDGPP